MTDKKSDVKQYLKLLLQKTLLPLCYNIGKRGNVDKKLVLFADSNSNSLPESMTALYDELRLRGIRCEAWCCDFSSAGFAGMLKFMCRFMMRYAVAGGLVICNYFVPAHACKKREQTLVVQLWHSCGALKKFGYSTTDDIPKSYKGSVSKNIDLVSVSSKACEDVFEQAFALKKGIAKATGVCRTDVFFDEDFKQASREKLYAKFPETKGKKLLLYAPTFRGDASHAYSVGEREVHELKSKLGDNWYIAVRMHPRVRNGELALSELNTAELLVCADMLITDYSSIIFEYALLDKPMLLWCPDLNDYIKKRDFYLDFKRDIPCPIVTDKERLLDAVKSEYQGFKAGRYSEFTKEYMSACDGKSTKRVADFLMRKE